MTEIDIEYDFFAFFQYLSEFEVFILLMYNFLFQHYWISIA